MTELLIVYGLLINVAAFLIMFIDKSRAIKNQWRISEKTILTVSLFGGSLGALAGMYMFRHKTKHLKFRILLPLFFVAHLLLLFWLLTGDLF